MAGSLMTSPSLPLVESDEHRALRASVRGIAERYGNRYMVERARAGEPPTALWHDLAEHGFLGVNVPERFEGGGLGLFELAIVEEELSAVGCPLFPLLVSPAIVGTILVRHGTPEQQERFLPGLGSGREHHAFALTEPDAGSNSHRVATRVRRTDAGFVLTGTKTYISGVEDSQRLMVIANSGQPGDRGRSALSAFLVDVDTPGLERQHIPTAVGMPDQQWTLFFDEVEVPADRLVGEEGGALALLFDGLNPERILAAAICTGVGMYALDKAAAYARERVVWGDTPIGAHQGVAHPLAEARIAVDAARLMAQKAAILHDAGADAGEASNMAKLLAADAGLRALDQAIQTHGGNGLADEYGLADLWFSTRLLKTAPVSREMILNYVAQHSLGLPRSY
jgi:alkylation response protein AidB-like acyl-CoA dehydrogenase